MFIFDKWSEGLIQPFPNHSQLWQYDSDFCWGRILSFLILGDVLLQKVTPTPPTHTLALGVEHMT